MKIVVFGSYNGGSIGDTAILLGFLSSLLRVSGGCADITVLSMGEVEINDELELIGIPGSAKEVVVNKVCNGSSNFFGKVVNKAWRGGCKIKKKPAANSKKIVNALSGADILLIGGGNLIMDLYPNWPAILRYVCELSIKEKVPYSFVGVGGAPITTEDGKNNLLFSLKGARDVFFRDKFSKRYCEEVLGFKDSSVGPDLAFGIDWPSSGVAEKNDALLLNLAAVYSERWPEKDPEKYNKYLVKMVELVDSLSRNLGFREVVVFNTNYPLDGFAVEDFLEVYSSLSQSLCSISYVKGRRKVFDLLSLCSHSKVALVTRLHAGIISSISGSNVLAIEYQPKVKDVLEHQVPGAYVVSFDELLMGKDFDDIDFISLKGKESERKVEVSDVDCLIVSALGVEMSLGVKI